MVADDDYATAGVCSQQARLAISAGVNGKLKVLGIATPYLLFKKLQYSGYVKKEYMIFNRQNVKDMLALSILESRIAKSYLSPPVSTEGGIRSW